MSSELLEQLYYSRPFKVRNADEYDLANVLDLFVDPTEGLINPFDYENTIIKGSMGSGKTMYLRANHAYYLYTLIPSILEKSQLILPVYIKLSDFQHIQDPEEIYKSLIVKIIEEMSLIYIHLQDAQRLAQIHNGITSLPPNIFNVDRKIREVFLELKKLNSDEYVEKIQKELTYSGAFKPKFFEASASFKDSEAIEIKEKSNPGISDIEHAYNKLLRDSDGKILLLIDEAGSVNKAFFREDGQETSMFEIFMNQLRTASYIRTKIAIYPHTYSDILTETRYGDMVNLQEDILEENGFELFKNRGSSLIERYISSAVSTSLTVSFILDPAQSEDQSDVLEQIINASNGNMRRFVQLLDTTMSEAFKTNHGQGKLEATHSISALKHHALSMERIFTEPDRDFLNSISNFCKTRSAYRFQFPYKAPILSKFINKSSEHNILNIVEMGSGSKGTTYAFDYAYCLYKDIPTHMIRDTERLDRTRSRTRGDWIRRVTRISEELILHASLPGKIEGIITFITDGKGFVTTENGKEYFWSSKSIIQEDQHKPLLHGKRLRFYPIKLSDSDYAEHIEVL